MVKVGDWVKLTGADWKEYEDVGAGVGYFVQISEDDGINIWAGSVGLVGNSRGLYSADNPEPSGDYAVELVSDEPPAFRVGDAVYISEEALRSAVTRGHNDGFSGNVDRVLSEVGSLLKEKNRSYGDSALNPIRVFSKADRLEQLYVRLDDKIARVKNGHEFAGDDTIRDMIGYLTLILIAREGE